MLTDGKINDNEWAVRLLVESTKYIRVFPVGIGADTNSHCIRCVPLCLVPLLPTMSLFMISNIFFLIDLLQRPVEVSQSSPDKEKTCEPVWSLYFLSSPLLPLFFHKKKKNKLILQTNSCKPASRAIISGCTKFGLHECAGDVGSRPNSSSSRSLLSSAVTTQGEV